jgi:uncharacterized protein (DUF1330 family)
MTAYAVAHLREVTVGAEIVEYLERIDATLEPFDGRFVVHGAEPTVLEGDFPGHLVVIGFPSREQAQGWYDSPAYQAILPLRTGNSLGAAILVDGVEPGYRATDMLGVGARPVTP